MIIFLCLSLCWDNVLVAADMVSATDLPVDEEILESFIVEDEPIDESPEGLHDTFHQPTLDVFTASTSEK